MITDPATGPAIQTPMAISMDTPQCRDISTLFGVDNCVSLSYSFTSNAKEAIFGDRTVAPSVTGGWQRWCNAFLIK